MTDVTQKKENINTHLKDLRQNLKKMHLEVTEELILPKPEDVVLSPASAPLHSSIR